MPRFIRWHVQEISGNLGMTSPISDRLGLAGYGWIWLDVEYWVVFLPVSTARWRKVEKGQKGQRIATHGWFDLFPYFLHLFAIQCNPGDPIINNIPTTTYNGNNWTWIQFMLRKRDFRGHVSLPEGRVTFQQMSIEDILTNMKYKPNCKNVQNSTKRMVDRKAVDGQACRIGFLFKDISTPAQFHCVIWCWGLSLELERCKSLRHWFERGHVLLGPAP